MEPSLKYISSKDFGRCPPKQTESLMDLTRPHVESFNFLLREGLSEAVQLIKPAEFELPDKRKASVFFSNAVIHFPKISAHNTSATNHRLYPAECRQKGSSYAGSLHVSLTCMVEDRPFTKVDRSLGEIPIMVKSSICNLNGLTPTQLVAHGEETNEMGGYFIVNGNEKVMRMLIMQRRNYPLCLNRPSWKNRGPDYTEFGISIRCCKADQTSSNVLIHYLRSGAAVVCLTYLKEQFFIPVMFLIKALLPKTDQQIYRDFIRGREDDSFYKGCILSMLRELSEESLFKPDDIMNFIGKTFRVKTRLPEWHTDRQVAEFILDQCLLIHLNSGLDKYRMLLYMTQKLFSFARRQCCVETADNPAFQEVLLPGQLYLMVLKEKMEAWLSMISVQVKKMGDKARVSSSFTTGDFHNVCSKMHKISRSLEYLIATGNLMSKSGLGLMQASGFTVVADKLNFQRYLSHFRSIHRGSFFSEMRTTAVRKLLPEAWGFICPVHTPDGTPCGLLNHLSANCQPVTAAESATALPQLLSSLGMLQSDLMTSAQFKDSFEVLLDGRVIGWIPEDLLMQTANTLRLYKVTQTNRVPVSLEIVPIPRQSGVAGPYPSLLLFSSMSRMMRPVTNLMAGQTELIGSFEQVYLNICVVPEEAYKGMTTHMELNELSMLSTLGNLTPFSDFNQSPRNIYQCQMGKQTMGTPCHSLPLRSDNKLYHVLNPQAPLVRPYMHDHYQMDDYPQGTNAIVAVISYTGYDMEDAFILHKGSAERGFGHGCVYKTEVIDLGLLSNKPSFRSTVSKIFGCPPGHPEADGRIGQDGLPYIGQTLEEGDPYYSFWLGSRYIDVAEGKCRVIRYKGQDAGYVMNVKLLGGDTGRDELQRVSVTLRVKRNPIIGDKFASRHGQKGICSQLWPTESMPFTETGIIPDILFNPHGYPSRMTIGMLIESMAGKSAAAHGVVHDATPFTFGEKDSAADYFGKMLKSAGYNYYGTERMYSGVTGRELEADIFIGVVYYQRLRHMVSDKFQVRTTGPVDKVTHQPVKGRKRAGGVRFGEMERDALLSHGAAFLLQDRLLLCSDKTTCHVCSRCGSILSPVQEQVASEGAAVRFERERKWTCCVCEEGTHIQTIVMPYVFRYLVAELASMNIKLTLGIKSY